MTYLISLVSAFIIVYFAMPLVIKLFVKYDFLDKPTKRKIHRDPIPLSGGVTMFIGFFIVYFGFFSRFMSKERISIFVGALLILLIGLVDDFYKTRGKEFPIYPRLIVQIISAIIVYANGISLDVVTNPFTGGFVIIPTIPRFILTILWLFGVTTVINWSDGMDGLAGSISSISSMTFFVVAVVMGQWIQAMTCVILLGVLVAFLRYNRYPAKVFMGDSGANFIGFILGVIALDGAFKQATVLSLFIPILALGVPIFDNIFVLFKRYSEGKPVYQADRSQIHYRLQEKGLSTEQVVTYITNVSLVLSVVSIVLIFIKI